MDGRATRDVAISITAAPRSAIAIDDVARWAALYEDLRPALVRALAAVFGSYDGVDDAIQDAFAAAMRGSPDDLRSPGGWLYAVASNKLRSRRRRFAVVARLRLRPSTQASPLDDLSPVLPARIVNLTGGALDQKPRIRHTLEGINDGLPDHRRLD